MLVKTKAGEYQGTYSANSTFDLPRSVVSSYFYSAKESMCPIVSYKFTDKKDSSYFFDRVEKFMYISSGTIKFNFEEMYNKAPDRLKVWIVASTYVG